MKHVGSEHGVHVILDTEPRSSPQSARVKHDRSLDIVILGDFAGAAAAPLEERRLLAVDRDDIEDVIARVRPALVSGIIDDGPRIETTFESIDHFHPDELLRRLPILAALDDLRRDVRTGRKIDSVQPAGPEAGGLLDRIVSASSAGGSSAPASMPRPSDLHGYIRSLLASHLIAEPDAEQTALLEQIEDTMSSLLRAILHHPQFQALESAWRGAWFLVRRLETGSHLKVHIVHITRDELLDESGATALQSWLNTTDGACIVACMHTFGTADPAALSRIGGVVRAAGAAFIAGGSPTLAGIDSFAASPDVADVVPTADPAWLDLRRSDVASHIALALPRFLLRVPYDPREEPCETIAFDEMSSPPAHDHYLWGGAALVPALLLGQAFDEHGWATAQAVVDGLPVHLYREGGETVVKPCAETLLTDRVALRMLEAGLMPVLSMKDGGEVRLATLQSIAQPSVALTGPWLKAL